MLSLVASQADLGWSLTCLPKLCFRIDNKCLIGFSSGEFPGHLSLSQTLETWFAHQFWLHLDV